MKINISPKVAKMALVGVGMLCTGIGSVIGDKVKSDNQKETIKKLIKEELTNQAKES